MNLEPEILLRLGVTWMTGVRGGRGGLMEEKKMWKKLEEIGADERADMSTESSTRCPLGPKIN